MPSKTGRIHYHILSYIILFYFILYYIILSHLILYYIILYYIILYYILLICYPINISKYSLMMPQKYSNIENESRDPQVCGEMFRLASRDPTVALTLADALHGDSYDSVLADRAAWLEPEKYGH